MESSFFEELENAVCYNARLYWNRNPSKPLTQLTEYVDTVTKIADSPGTASSFTAHYSRDLSSTYNQNRRGSQSQNISSGSKTFAQCATNSSKSRQTNSIPSLEPVTHRRVCLQEDQTFRRFPLVSPHAKLNQEREKY